MNRKNILSLADLIEAQPHTSPMAKEGFTMESWTHPCGTPGCIAGFAAYEKMGRPADIVESVTSIMETAQKYLDLDFYESRELFLAGNRDIDLKYITPTQAAKVLRHLAETGEVDWSII